MLASMLLAVSIRESWYLRIAASSLLQMGAVAAGGSSNGRLCVSAGETSIVLSTLALGGQVDASPLKIMLPTVLYCIDEQAIFINPISQR